MNSAGTTDSTGTTDSAGTTDSTEEITAEVLSCGDRDTDIVQVLIGKLDSGLSTLDSYRLSGNGDLTRASWNSNDQLLGVSDLVNIGAEAYLDAVNILSSIEQSESTESEDGILSSPPVFTVEIAFAKAQTDVTYIVSVEESDPLDELIYGWHQVAQLRQPPNGDYVWTLPGPTRVSFVDTVISQPNCDLEINSIVNDAALGPSVVVNTPDIVDELLIESGTGRSRYVARTSYGSVFFGVLSAQ